MVHSYQHDKIDKKYKNMIRLKNHSSPYLNSLFDNLKTNKNPIKIVLQIRNEHSFQK